MVKTLAKKLSIFKRTPMQPKSKLFICVSREFSNQPTLSDVNQVEVRLLNGELLFSNYDRNIVRVSLGYSKWRVWMGFSVSHRALLYAGTSAQTIFTTEK